MTFSVVAIGSEQEKVVGLIWADGEAQAHDMATSVCTPKPGESLVIRPTDRRELPLKLPN